MISVIAVWYFVWQFGDLLKLSLSRRCGNTQSQGDLYGRGLVLWITIVRFVE